jgi:predicted flap endonuclease-1-like 5' DNA nuclease
MLDVIGDAWPWLIPAFLIGLVCGWYITLAWCRDRHPRTGAAQPVKGAAPVMAMPAQQKRPARAKPLDLAAAKTVLGFTVKKDDLTVIEGIGSRINDLLRVDGITTWKELGAAKPEHLRRVLDAAGSKYNLHDPKTWPRQARLLAGGKWAEFKELTDKLVGGK